MDTNRGHELTKRSFRPCLFGGVFICTLLLFAASGVSAQARVHGKIVAADGSPLSFANVLLLNPTDSAMVKGEVADGDGVYAFNNIPAGAYLLLGSMVGYKKTYSLFEIKDRTDFQVPDLVIEEDSKVLGEVTVQAQKPLYEQQMDKLVINIENNITAAGGTVLEVLERSPGVMVNRQNNSLSMAGKQGVLVMINGKIQRLPMATIVQMLAGMNASSIEKVEVISNPSSKYDAQGDGGIINIVFKQNPDLGTNGSVSATAGMGYQERYSGSFNINHRTEKFNLFTDYSYNRAHLNQVIDFERDLSGEHTESGSHRDGIQRIQRFSIGSEFYLTKKTTLGFGVSGFDDLWSMVADNASITSVGSEVVRTVDLVNDEDKSLA